MSQGPIAMPASRLPSVFRVQTKVNCVEKQNATTDDLIFSIPVLVKTLSEGTTLQPGDVIATGTPAGVGMGKDPPEWMKPGDRVEVSVTGLGTLHNRIADPSGSNSTVARLSQISHIPSVNVAKTVGGIGLTKINSKLLYYHRSGSESSEIPLVFVHGLGGTSEFYTPLIDTLSLSNHNSVHVHDLEGHGRSPTLLTSKLSIDSYASDVHGVFQDANIKSGATLIAHSMGCLIALSFVLKHPNLVSRLILLGPPPSPLPEAGSKGSFARAATVRQSGMGAVVQAVSEAGTSEATKSSNPLALTAVRMSLLGQDPEGYAKGCTALANSASQTLDISKVEAKTLIVTGDEDKVSPPSLCEKMIGTMPNAQLKVLKGVGHWHIFEDAKGVSDAVKEFLV